MLLRDVSGDSFDGAESFVRAGGYRGGDERSGAVFRDFASDGAQRAAASFHDVVAAGAVDVHVEEAGDGGLVGGANFLRSRGQAHSRARADGFDHVFANQDARIVDFRRRSQSTAGVNENGRHGRTTS